MNVEQSVTIAPSTDELDVYYAMCSDITKMFKHIPTGLYYVQIALGCNSNKHPDEIVKALATQLQDYDIVGDKAC